MSNHFHILLEVPPVWALELDDEGLLKRLSAIYSEAFVAEIAKELTEARSEENEEYVTEIYRRYTYRMHDLSEFMKTLLQRFTRWFNRTHDRTGTLWEQRYKSVIVESGEAARTMAAYIDLNPVRAGMVSDPAEYRWSSYGEAIGVGEEERTRGGWGRFAWSNDEYRRDVGLERQRDGAVGFGDGEHAADAGEVFYGRSGNREQDFCK
jgi:hypothetical protein